MITNRHVLFLFRLIVGGVFIWAGALKIADPLGFAQNIENYRLFPHILSFFLALTLPWIEVVAGAMLILGVWRRPNSLITSALLAAFIVLVFTAVVRGIDTDCGCFGSLSGKADVKLMITDISLCFCSLNIFLAA
jgi:putative oxidoreductase